VRACVRACVTGCVWASACVCLYGEVGMVAVRRMVQMERSPHRETV
jgi:hypothetical protein